MKMDFRWIRMEFCQMLTTLFGTGMNINHSEMIKDPKNVILLGRCRTIMMHILM